MSNVKGFEDVLDDLCLRFLLNCPEEVYCSYERFCFQLEGAHWFYEDFYRQANLELPKLTFEKFSVLIFQHLKLPENDLLQEIKNFTKYKHKIPVYGAILFLENNEDKILLVQHFRSQTWGFPKGKINKDESEEACAIREVREEIGFDISKLINSNFYYQLPNQSGKLFIIKGINKNQKFKSETRNEICKIQWHNINEIKKDSDHFFKVNNIILDIKKRKIIKQNGTINYIKNVDIEKQNGTNYINNVDIEKQLKIKKNK